MPDLVPPPPGILATVGATFRQNRLACVLLNVLVIVLVATYYTVPAVAVVWESVGVFKMRWSYGFSLASTVFAAVLLPSLVQWILGTLPVVGRIKRIALVRTGTWVTN